jgi:hypothetical protein
VTMMRAGEDLGLGDTGVLLRRRPGPVVSARYREHAGIPGREST